MVRHVQAARKNAGLNVDDRITLSLTTGDSELQKAIEEYADTITAETLAEALTATAQEHASTVKIEGVELEVSLQKK